MIIERTSLQLRCDTPGCNNIFQGEGKTPEYCYAWARDEGWTVDVEQGIAHCQDCKSEGIET